MTSSSPTEAHRTPGPDLLAALPPGERQALARLTQAFSESGQHLALVGGIVRDYLLGSGLPTDLDITTSAPPEETRRLGTAAGATTIYDVGEKFGTIGLVFPNETDPSGPAIVVEVTTYRSEHYPDDTRKPAVVLGGSLVDDLARRDFTANAIAFDLRSHEIVDPFDGQADLHRGIIRAVGEPDVRFQEDPLRLLRAARFVARLGFLIEAGTAAAILRQAESLGRISQERIYAELTKLLIGPYAGHGLDALLDGGLFTIALPELRRFAAEATAARGPHREKDLWDHTLRVVERTPPRPIVRWAALLHDAAKPQTRSLDSSGEVHFYGHEREGAEIARKLLTRLKADKETRESVTRLVELHLRPAVYETDWTDSAVRRLTLDADRVLDDLLDLAAADVTSAREQKQRDAAVRIANLRGRIAQLEAEHALAEFKSPLDGEDLMRMFDRPPGRWIAVIKHHLRELVVDGELPPGDRAGAAIIARELEAANR